MLKKKKPILDRKFENFVKIVYISRRCRFTLFEERNNEKNNHGSVEYDALVRSSSIFKSPRGFDTLKYQNKSSYLKYINTVWITPSG